MAPLSNISARKRAASSSPSRRVDDDEWHAHAAARAKHASELDDAGLIPADQAWPVDLSAILGPAAADLTISNRSGSREDHDDNAAAGDDGSTTAGAEPWPDGRLDGTSSAASTADGSRCYQPRHGAAPATREALVLCVLGALDAHYWMLAGEAPALRSITRGVRCLAVAVDVAAWRARLFGAQGSQQAGWDGASCGEEEAVGRVPLVGVGAGRGTVFARLGLLHPLGGGRAPLDALVVLEKDGDGWRRRMVLPFGWGAGRHVLDQAGGWLVRARLMEVLREGIEELCREWEDG